MEEASGPAVDLWPDNLPAITLLHALRTQWRYRPNGCPEGLHYASITPLLLESCGVTLEQWREHVGADLREAEIAALKVRRAQWREAMERLTG